MTVAELIEELKEKPSNARVYVGLKGKQYDTDRVVSISMYNWEIVGNDVVIISR